MRKHISIWYHLPGEAIVEPYVTTNTTKDDGISKKRTYHRPSKASLRRLARHARNAQQIHPYADGYNFSVEKENN